MGRNAARERSLSILFPLTRNRGDTQTSQELLSKQSLCVTTQSTLYSGSSLAMTLTRRHTGGEEGKDGDLHDRSLTSNRFGTITLGTKVLRSVSNHRKENKANDVAQEATNEGASRTLSDPGVDITLQSPNKLYSNKQSNMQRPQRSRAGGPGDIMTHPDPSDAHRGLQQDDRREISTQLVVENSTSKEETVGQDTTDIPELTADHTGARGAPEVTATGIQQRTHQLNVEHMSLPVVDNSTSKEDTVGQDTTGITELATDHTGARGAPEVTATGIQARASAERRTQATTSCREINQQRRDRRPRHYRPSRAYNGSHRSTRCP